MASEKFPTHIKSWIQAQTESWKGTVDTPMERRDAFRPTPFITISRQFGCRAFELGEKVSLELNRGRKNPPYFEVFDRKILEILSKESHITEAMLEQLHTQTRSTFEDWMIEVIGGIPSEIKTFRELAKTVFAVASKGHIILVGRGSSFITKGVPGGIHVRLVASPAFRLDFLKQNKERAAQATLKNLEKIDKDREGFVRRYFHTDIHDPTNYDLTLNVERLTFDEQTHLIIECLKIKSKRMARELISNGRTVNRKRGNIVS